MARFIKLVQSAVLLACTGGWAIAFPTTTSAQTATAIPITGGNVVFGDTQIFVPNINGVDLGTDVFRGSVPDSFQIRTSQGDIPLNAILRGSFVANLNTPAGGVPAVGDTGDLLATLSFRGFSATGEPALFTNIPVSLEFQVNSIVFGDQTTPYTKYRTQPFSLLEVGTVETSDTFIVTRSTPAVYVQYQESGNPPVG